MFHDYKKKNKHKELISDHHNLKRPASAARSTSNSSEGRSHASCSALTPRSQAHVHQPAPSRLPSPGPRSENVMVSDLEHTRGEEKEFCLLPHTQGSCEANASLTQLDGAGAGNLCAPYQFAATLQFQLSSKREELMRSVLSPPCRGIKGSD